MDMSSLGVPTGRTPNLSDAEVGRRLGRVYSRLLRLADEADRAAATADPGPLPSDTQPVGVSRGGNQPQAAIN
jgi:hypothetical protein